jgi:hypothetical protein
VCSVSLFLYVLQNLVIEFGCLAKKNLISSFSTLQKLLQIPIVSSCIEVWDFLSVDSQVSFLTSFLSA